MFNKRLSFLSSIGLFVFVSFIDTVHGADVKNDVEKKSSYSKKVGDIIEASTFGIGVGLLVSSIFDISFDSKLMKSSYEYIKEIPTPIKLFCAGSSITLIGTIFLIARKLNKYEQQLEIMNNVLKETLDVQLSQSKEFIQEQMERNNLSIEVQEIQCKLDLLTVKFIGQWQTTTESLNVLHKRRLESEIKINNRMNLIEYQQKKVAPLVDIFQELQEDIRYRKEDVRYREKVARAEQIENNRCRHNKYNLGGVE